MFKSKISKEEVNQMPISVFEGQITLVDELWQVKDAVAVLKQSAFFLKQKRKTNDNLVYVFVTYCL